MPNLAELTPEEQKAWDFAFAFYGESGWLGDEAAEHAWKDLQAEFPRVQGFDGCKP
jgi:hypothetical protein